MKIELSLVDDDGERLPSLVRWLRRDDDVRAAADVALDRDDSRPGHMGGAVEIVNVVLSNAIALSSLVVAVAAWRGSRQQPPTVRITHRTTVVELHASSTAEVDRVLHELEQRASDS